MNINWHPRDDRLNSFILRYIDSFASWDLTLFLHHNPTTSDTVDGFARRLGRSCDEVESSLERFCDLGSVRKQGMGRDAVFSPCLTPAAKEEFATFAHAQEDRELRLMLIRSILQGKRE
ncbi:MAG: hypothetical protein C4521_08690 [Actinobacteria bacterium]|jgi:hypothetical protein|nr:MAG: hypothetical protein C4521_08690 [Actinomycetota bacterium]